MCFVFVGICFRSAYEQALAAQLKKQSDAALAEASIKKQMMEQTAKKQLAEYQLQIEEWQGPTKAKYCCMVFQTFVIAFLSRNT